MQLQLLTAIVKLFLKKPTETQELVQQVLSLATQVGAASLGPPREPIGSPAPNPQLRELSQTDRVGGGGGDAEPACKSRGEGSPAVGRERRQGQAGLRGNQGAGLCLLCA